MEIDMCEKNLNKVNNKKFCFIICSNNKYYLEECIFYISQLEIPEGYSVDVISVLEAESMAGGYNEGMKSTDAGYKIYLHQDTFIIYKRFLQSVLDIFGSDSSIGMIGMVGTPKMSVSGVMWYGHREGELYGFSVIQEDYEEYQYKLEDGVYEVDAVDGFIMITNKDIRWREDIFDGWDFYDVSQSFEFAKRGFKIVVPEQYSPWCMHLDGILNFLNYNKYRKICMAEYPEYFEPKRFLIEESKEKSNTNDIYVIIIARNQFELVKRNVDIVKLIGGVEESQIIVVDNGSEDGLRHWLKRQKKLNYIICGEIIENYASIVNKVAEHFIMNEDILILNAELMLLPDCLENMIQTLKMDSKVGAVCGKIISCNFQNGKSIWEAAEYAYQQKENNEKRKLVVPHFEGVLIRNKMLKILGDFNEKLFLPQSSMLELALKGRKEQYVCYELQNALLYKAVNIGNIYEERFGSDIDSQMIEEILIGNEE